MTANQIAYWKMVIDREHNERQDAETFRSNQERETENKRHNKATEALSSSQIFGNLDLGYSTLSEGIRHAMAVEDETHRSNVAQEEEKYRHNVVQEEISNSGNLLNWGKLGSTTGSINPGGAIAGVAAGAVTTPRSSGAVGNAYMERMTDALSHLPNTTSKVKDALSGISSSLGSILSNGSSSMYREGSTASHNPRDPKYRNQNKSKK